LVYLKIVYLSRLVGFSELWQSVGPTARCNHAANVSCQAVHQSHAIEPSCIPPSSLLSPSPTTLWFVLLQLLWSRWVGYWRNRRSSKLHKLFCEILQKPRLNRCLSQKQEG